MTTAQERAIEKFKEAALKRFGHPETKEIKKFDIVENTEYDYLYIHLEIGLIGDEGTMAEIICRHIYTVSIGKRGSYYGYRKSGKKVTYDSLFTALKLSDLDAIIKR